MSALYEESDRRLQRQFDTQRFGRSIEEGLFRTALTDDDRAFIGKLDLFFLATVNSRGEPSCSYKGGDPGFVRVLDPRIHKYALVERSKFVPHEGAVTPVPNRKQMDWARNVLPHDDPARSES
jgi:hypothetical protein